MKKAVIGLFLLSLTSCTSAGKRDILKLNNSQARLFILDLELSRPKDGPYVSECIAQIITPDILKRCEASFYPDAIKTLHDRTQIVATEEDFRDAEVVKFFSPYIHG